MTISRKNLLASGIAVSVALLVSCGKGSPTAPAADSNAPSISSISPANPSPSPAVQTITVAGANFRTGLVFSLRGPDGAVNAYSQTVSGVTTTSFSVAVVLSAPGSWTASVKNIDGLESSGSVFTVSGTESSGPPQILSITPGILFRNASVQSFSINGQNFRAGATVSVTNPAGSELQSSIASLSDSSITVNATFNATGLYTVTVRNADGSQSGPFSLTVNP